MLREYLSFNQEQEWMGSRSREWRSCKAYPSADCTTLVWEGSQGGRPCPPPDYTVDVGVQEEYVSNN